FGVVRQRALVVLAVLVDRAAVVVGEAVLGIEPDRLAVGSTTGGVFAFAPIREAPVENGIRVLGIEPDRLAVVGNRPVVVAFVRIGEATVVKGSRVLGL